jgi:hypothetical protein
MLLIETLGVAPERAAKELQIIVPLEQQGSLQGL